MGTHEEKEYVEDMYDESTGERLYAYRILREDCDTMSEFQALYDSLFVDCEENQFTFVMDDGVLKIKSIN